MDPAEQTPRAADADPAPPRPTAERPTAERPPWTSPGLEARRSRAEFGARVCLTAAGALVLLSAAAPAPFALVGLVCAVILGTGLRVEAAVLTAALERRAG